MYQSNVVQLRGLLVRTLVKQPLSYFFLPERARRDKMASKLPPVVIDNGTG